MPKIFDLMFKNIDDRLKKVNNQRATLFVGWTEPKMAMIANVHEYGANISVTDKMRGFLAWKYGIYLKKNTTQIVIPPRAHRKQLIMKNKDKWSKQLSVLLIKNNYDIVKSLGALGAIMRQDYSKILKDGKFKELSAATMLIRGIDNIPGSQPLYATGALETNLTYEVYSG